MYMYICICICLCICIYVFLHQLQIVTTMCKLACMLLKFAERCEKLQSFS